MGRKATTEWAVNYMRISRKQVGYLINFGPLGEVEWKRFVLTDSIKK